MPIEDDNVSFMDRELLDFIEQSYQDAQYSLTHAKAVERSAKETLDKAQIAYEDAQGSVKAAQTAFNRAANILKHAAAIASIK